MTNSAGSVRGISPEALATGHEPEPRYRLCRSWSTAGRGGEAQRVAGCGGWGPCQRCARADQGLAPQSVGRHRQRPVVGPVGLKVSLPPRASQARPRRPGLTTLAPKVRAIRVSCWLHGGRRRDRCADRYSNPTTGIMHRRVRHGAQDLPPGSHNEPKSAAELEPDGETSPA